MNQVLARKLAHLVRSQLAGVLQAPVICQLALQVVVADAATTASAGAGPEDNQAVITLPTQFCGVRVEGDTQLYLGLLAHEVAHLPDLDVSLPLLETAQQEQGEPLAVTFNFTEDMRIESALLDEPVNLWLTHTRALAGADLPGTPHTFWEYLGWLRFGNPVVPFNVAPPPGADAGFWNAAVGILRTGLKQGVQGAYQAAQQLLELARYHGIPVPEPPPHRCADAGSAPRGQAATPVPGQLRPRLPGQGWRPPEWTAPDLAALEAGRRLARQLRSWWTQSTRAIAGGVGRYNPRLEASGIPPFTLPLARQTAPPPRVGLFLDISDSMWDGQQRLHLARIAATAIATAVQAAGGQVRLWAFDGNATALPLGANLHRAVSVRGYGTSLAFLKQVAPALRGWHTLFITDAQVGGVPPVWDAAFRRDAAVILISDDTGDLVTAQQLGERVLPVTDIRDLPHLTALAARRFFGAAGRA